MLEIRPENPEQDQDAIEALFHKTFGPGHFAKTAERLREFSHSIPDLNRVAVLDARIVGVCRVWPIQVGAAADLALFYGPVAVDSTYRGNRLGLSITGEALEAGAAAGWNAAVLIGAPAYFTEIGFVVTPPEQLLFPGPQDQTRVMVRDLAGDASKLSGLVMAAAGHMTPA